VLIKVATESTIAIPIIAVRIRSKVGDVQSGVTIVRSVALRECYRRQQHVENARPGDLRLRGQRSPPRRLSASASGSVKSRCRTAINTGELSCRS